MKKALLILAAAFSLNAKAQTNGEFENWTTTGNYEDPTGWVTFNLFSTLGDSLSVLKYTPPYSGNYSVLMRPVYSVFASDTVPAIMYQGIPYTSRPNSARFAYMQTSASGDSGFISVEFYKGATSDPSNMIGYAQYYPTANLGWKRVETDITWLDVTNPDTMLVYIVSPIGFGSKMLIDDISVSIYSAKTTPLTQDQCRVFVARSGKLAVIQPKDYGFDKIRIMNTNGQLVKEMAVLDGTTVSDFTLPSGIYIYELTSSENSDRNYKGKLYQP